jgi:hypothetical protein
MIYDSKAVATLEIQLCKFDLLKKLQDEGWEKRSESQGIVYFRKPWTAEHS